MLRTRKGLNWTTKFGAVARATARLPDGIYDGEVVALDELGRPDFNLLQHYRTGASSIHYDTFMTLHYFGAIEFLAQGR